MNERKLRQAVDQGARLLDLKRPGWARIIDLDRLDISSCWNCILGQVYGAFGTGEVRLGLGYGDDDIGLPMQYGFESVSILQANQQEDYRRLRALWREEILRRTPGRVAEVEHGSR